jgi:hypothetical protein
MWITFASLIEDMIHPAASTTQTDAEAVGGYVIY